jgi:hypothetical protein
MDNGNERLVPWWGAGHISQTQRRQRQQFTSAVAAEVERNDAWVCLRTWSGPGLLICKSAVCLDGVKLMGIRCCLAGSYLKFSRSKFSRYTFSPSTNALNWYLYLASMKAWNLSIREHVSVINGYINWLIMTWFWIACYIASIVAL